MSKAKAVTLNFKKSDLANIMEQYTIYIHYLSETNQTLPVSQEKYLSFCNKIKPSLLDISKMTLQMTLPLSTVHHMYQAMLWSKTHINHRKEDYGIMNESINVLKGILQQTAHAEKEHDNDSNDEGLYHASASPSFTEDEISLIAIAVKQYLPKLAHKMSVPSANVEVVLPRGDYKVLDADSLMTVDHAMTSGESDIVPQLNDTKRRLWSETQRKVSVCRQIVDKLVLKRLAKIRRMIQHSFVREAMNQLFGNEIKHNIHLHKLLAESAPGFKRHADFVYIKHTLPVVHKLAQTCSPSIVVGLVPYLHKLNNMQKHGYQFAVVNHNNDDKKLTVHPVKADDAVQLINKLTQAVKKELA